MNRALEMPPYNLVIHTRAVCARTAATFYHWHVEIMPKLTRTAGFEWGTGFYINPTSPEEAAEVLRAVQAVRAAGLKADPARVVLLSVRRERE